MIPIRYKLTDNSTKSVSHKAYSPTFFVIDAEGAVLGRLAAFVANKLRGKTRSDYTPNAFCQERIIILNANKVILSGKKESDAIYYRHTEFPGGMKQKTAHEIRIGKNPQDLIKLAVKGMLSKGPLAYKMLNSITFYNNSEHMHEAQNPVVLDFKSMNWKNSRNDSDI